MNQVTRRMTGSLIERAAQRYDFAAPKVRVEEREPTPETPTQPLPVRAELVEAPFFSSHAAKKDGPLRLAGTAGRSGQASTSSGQAGVGVGRPSKRHAAIDRARLAEQGLIEPGAPVSGLAEEFRIVKRQLLQAARATPGDVRARRILVCSAQPEEGKSFCAVNLALSLAAEKDVEVVLIDADFAKAEVPVMLGIDGGRGLLDALADRQLDVEDLVIATDVPNLSLLPAGTRSNDDTELLASARTLRLLDALQEANPNRVLVFDSPPALAASPASTLAHMVGQVLLVVRADKTPENELREAVALLDGPAELSLLLNRARFAPGGKRFGTYYGYGA